MPQEPFTHTHRWTCFPDAAGLLHNCSLSHSVCVCVLMQGRWDAAVMIRREKRERVSRVGRTGLASRRSQKGLGNACLLQVSEAVTRDPASQDAHTLFRDRKCSRWSSHHRTLVNFSSFCRILRPSCRRGQSVLSQRTSPLPPHSLTMCRLKHQRRMLSLAQRMRMPVQATAAHLKRVAPSLVTFAPASAFQHPFDHIFLEDV